MSERDEIEAIQQLKYRYMRAVDLKLWDELHDTFWPEVVCSYGDGTHSFEGRDAVLGFLRDSLGGNLVTLHQVHHPQIEITGPNTARGRWYLVDYVINAGPDRPLMKGRSTLLGAAFYHDQYEKRDGEWRILSTGYERTFEQFDDLPESSEVHSRWDAEAG